MLNRPGFSQTEIETVTFDQLVPKDHLLRKIDAAVDFSIIYDRVAALYCPDNGHPPLDPTLMFKALFIGDLFGLRSERQLVRDRGQRRLPLVSAVEAHRAGVRRLDLEPEPAPPFQRCARREGHFRRHRQAGASSRLRRGTGSPY